MIRHVLSRMASHTFVVSPVLKMVITRINVSLSTLFWDESNDIRKRKWSAWTKICKPVEEGGAGIRDMQNVKRAFHMMFSWRLLTVDNLWTRFFRVNYIKTDHLERNYKLKYSRMFIKICMLKLEWGRYPSSMIIG